MRRNRTTRLAQALFDAMTPRAIEVLRDASSKLTTKLDAFDHLWDRLDTLDDETVALLDSVHPQLVEAVRKAGKVSTKLVTYTVNQSGNLMRSLPME